MERLGAAALKGPLSAGGDYVYAALGEIRHLFAANETRQDRMDREAQEFVARSGRSSHAGETWRDIEGRAISVYAPDQKLSAGVAASPVGLGDIVRAMVTQRGPRPSERTRSTGSISTDGALVPATLATEVIDRLRALRP